MPRQVPRQVPRQIPRQVRWEMRWVVRWGVRWELEVGRLLRINQGGATVVLLREVSLEARRGGGPADGLGLALGGGRC